MPLDTLENLKLSIGVSVPGDDDFLTDLQAAADAFITGFCGREFASGTIIEDHPGGGRMIFLREFPITAVTSVHVDPERVFAAATLLATSRYFTHLARGVVESLNGPFLTARSGQSPRADSFPGTVRVTYVAPASSVPAAVKRAYAELIGFWYRQTKTHVETNQLNRLQTTDGTVVTEYPWGQSGGYRIPKSVLQTLHLYRVPQV